MEIDTQMLQVNGSSIAESRFMTVMSDSKVNPLPAVIHVVALLMLATEQNSTNSTREFPQSDVHGLPLITLEPSSVPVSMVLRGGSLEWWLICPHE